MNIDGNVPTLVLKGRDVEFLISHFSRTASRGDFTQSYFSRFWQH